MTNELTTENEGKPSPNHRPRKHVANDDEKNECKKKKKTININIAYTNRLCLYTPQNGVFSQIYYNGGQIAKSSKYTI